METKGTENGKNQERTGNRNRGRYWKNSRKPRNRKSKLPPIICSVCEKPIDSVSQAIGGPEKDQYMHFDCVLRNLAEQEEVNPGQKICYIGNGEFAIVEYKKKNFSGGFTIVKRIEYENQEMKSLVKKMVSERKRTARI